MRLFKEYGVGSISVLFMTVFVCIWVRVVIALALDL